MCVKHTSYLGILSLYAFIEIIRLPQCWNSTFAKYFWKFFVRNNLQYFIVSIIDSNLIEKKRWTL